MAKKGSAKNTKNKALHSKLIKQKINKVKASKVATKERLKAIIKKSQQNKL
ncbi:hypothetical protein MHL31_04330 [Lutibacter sp. A80]|uniref:hypothetical protein n=1 Tax=Lutibacter sp. A80 TaxID=2918453 RepID=UPI001F06A98B|nr:hypothetical protein [Lutibacter sp. A80]UMB61436.1 hypothetical protein MHL31_04330 [Lutibacter sp. A80]